MSDFVSNFDRLWDPLDPGKLASRCSGVQILLLSPTSTWYSKLTPARAIFEAQVGLQNGPLETRSRIFNDFNMRYVFDKISAYKDYPPKSCEPEKLRVKVRSGGAVGYILQTLWL